jgi:hypothetical protein
MTTKITEKNISSLANAGVNWQAVVVADGSTGLTAVAGRGYFIDTTSGTITVTLPTSPNVGDVVVLKDYARKWATNNVTIASTTLDGATNNPSFSTNGQTVTLIYMDNTRGWSLINEDTTTGLGAEFISATGGTVLTSGDFKTHVFTGDGCFVVATAGNAVGSNSVEYVVVAGGGGAGRGCSSPNCKGGGGGGAGGFRNNYPSPTSTGLSVSAQTYPITVGGGGNGSSLNANKGTSGSNSVFSTITSAGGGGGGSQDGPVQKAFNGGSGGGGGQADNPSPQGDYSVSPGNPNVSLTGGTGNTPPTSPPQGNNGGGSWNQPGTTGGGGGGGGAGAVGGDASDYIYGGNGGDGSPIDTTFFGPTSPSYGTPGPAPGRYFAGGGGGGGASNGANTTYGKGGAGGGAASPGTSGGACATANTGGGGGGGGTSSGGNGGKGIVLIRYKFQ